ncbi:MAG: enoyl-CoA hydratase/isomerase family protein [Dehalococcoidia bacterium]|nr:enoyl-CoA hydratase/isomerase family protein [Dehalococcoidia bacterium]
MAEQPANADSTSQAEGEPLLLDVRQGVAWITLNRPDALNALNGDLTAALMAALERVRDDDAIRVGVITGAGRAFCAGADLKDRVRNQDEGRGPTAFPAAPPPSYFSFDTDKPMIAAVNGYCLGAGLELALTCDFRIASTQASFGLPEITLGFFPGAGAPIRLPRVIGFGQALEMLFTGERIDATHAREYGLVNRVVQPEGLLPEVERVALKIASNAPLAVKSLRDVIYQGMDMTLPQALRFGGALRWAIGQTEDAKEGPRAFAEKRPPEFKGR